MHLDVPMDKAGGTASVELIDSWELETSTNSTEEAPARNGRGQQVISAEQANMEQLNLEDPNGLGSPCNPISQKGQKVSNSRLGNRDSSSCM